MRNHASAIGCLLVLFLTTTLPAAEVHSNGLGGGAWSDPATWRGNTVRGLYSYGIMGTAQTDSVVTGNTIEKCSAGIYWYGENGMIKQATIRDCSSGVVITSMSGALEDITVEGALVGLYHAGATAQVTSMHVRNLLKNGKAVQYASGPLRLLNCNIKPDQIEILKVDRPGTPEFLVQNMEYLIVGAKGDIPAGTRVEVVTANPLKPLPPGATDLNIRNGPAPILKNGLTPLPKTQELLVVKSWQIDPAGKVVPAPEYTVKLVGPGMPGKVLKEMKVKPGETWYREKPNEAIPTVEVLAK